jgi:hypothetical protein
MSTTDVKVRKKTQRSQLLSPLETAILAAPPPLHPLTTPVLFSAWRVCATCVQEWAGNGSMVGAIAGSTKREPITVGKPAEFMLDNIAKTFNLQRHQICMVGDRLDTDILFGKNGGLTTCLVLSGGSTARCSASRGDCTVLSAVKWVKNGTNCTDEGRTPRPVLAGGSAEGSSWRQGPLYGEKLCRICTRGWGKVCCSRKCTLAAPVCMHVAGDAPRGPVSRRAFGAGQSGSGTEKHNATVC